MRIQSFFLLFIAILLFFTTPTFALKKYATSANHRGFIKLSNNFFIFPENRRGNAIYKRNKELFVKTDTLILKNILATPYGHVYYGISTKGKHTLKYKGEKGNRFWEISPGYFQLITKTGTKKFYRLTPNFKIQDLLEHSRTASGLIRYKDGSVAFHHISKGEAVKDETGKPIAYKYSFRVHIVRPQELKQITLVDTVTDFSSYLRISWVNVNTIQYKLKDGSTHQLRIP
ncbi:MAG: hypothetical protein ACI86H_002669 [bacterium]|jgi:hypothetical protein